MNAAAGAAARGPFAYLLQTQTGQWLVLGLGAFSVFPDKCEEIVRPLLRSLILGFPNHPLASDLAAFGSRASSSPARQQSPIVIQTSGSGSSASDKIWGQVISYAITGAGVWITYTVMVKYLPDWAKEMLPVTRQVFDKAVHNLGKGIVELSQQILTLGRKQDETHGELMEAREDIHNVQSALGRCEDSLEDAGKTNNRSAKGIKLLVRAVATLVPGNNNIAEELNLFAKEIDIDPRERGEYLDAQQRNVSNPNLYQSPAYSGEDNRFGKMVSPKGSRTPTTRSMSTGSDDMSEISDDGPKGAIVMENPADVSLMSTLYSPTPRSAKKGSVLPSSTLNIQNRIEALLNHGRVM